MYVIDDYSNLHITYSNCHGILHYETNSSDIDFEFKIDFSEKNDIIIKIENVIKCIDSNETCKLVLKHFLDQHIKLIIEIDNDNTIGFFVMRDNVDLYSIYNISITPNIKKHIIAGLCKIIKALDYSYYLQIYKTWIQLQ